MKSFYVNISWINHIFNNCYDKNLVQETFLWFCYVNINYLLALTVILIYLSSTMNHVRANKSVRHQYQAAEMTTWKVCIFQACLLLELYAWNFGRSCWSCLVGKKKTDTSSHKIAMLIFLGNQNSLDRSYLTEKL